MRTTEPQSNETSSRTSTLHARDVLAFLRRGAPLALIVALIAGAVAFIAARNAEPVYQASAALLSTDPSEGVTDVEMVTPPPVDPAVYRVALLEGPVLADVLERVDGEPPTQAELERFADRVSVGVEDQEISSVVRIGVEHPDPQYAAVVANTITDSLIAWDRSRAFRGTPVSAQAIERSIDVIDAELQGGETLNEARRNALTTLRQQRVDELSQVRSGVGPAGAVGRLDVLRVATSPEEPLRPRPLFAAILAALVGLVLAYAFLFVRDSLGERLRSRDELAHLVGAPVLAEFPRPARSARSATEESAGLFHTSLVMATRGATPLVVAITSPADPNEKGGVAVALAESFARGDHRTLLVDGDLRRAGTTEGLDVKTKQSAPFEAHLENPDGRYAPATVAIGGKGTFDFVPSFTSAEHPAELLNKGLGDQMAVWRGEYDVIIIDAPPVLPFADALAIADHCSGAVLCASLRGSSMRRIDESVQLLHRSDVPILGAVLTDVPAHHRRVKRPAGANDGLASPDASARSYRSRGRGSDRRPSGATDRR